MGERDQIPIAQAGDHLTLDAYRIKMLIAEELEERSSVDEASHKQHHEFIADCKKELSDFVAERRKRREFWDRVWNTAVGALVVTCVGGLLTALAFIGKLVIQAMHHDPNVVVPK